MPSLDNVILGLEKEFTYDGCRYRISEHNTEFIIYSLSQVDSQRYRALGIYKQDGLVVVEISAAINANTSIMMTIPQLESFLIMKSVMSASVFQITNGNI